MARTITLVPPTRVADGETFTQSLDEALDTSGHEEMAVVTRISAVANANVSSAEVELETAVDNVEGRYATLASLTGEFTNVLSTGTHYRYFAGPGAAGSGQPGFGRFVRVSASVVGTSGAWLVFDVKAVLKP